VRSPPAEDQPDLTIQAALAAQPRAGLAGPSTNLAWNAQRVAGAPEPRAPIDRVEAFGHALAARRGARHSIVEPRHSLSDFCYAVRREVLEAVGAADEAFGDGPCWEMEYNARAAAAGFDGVWVHAAYVHRLPIAARRRQAEARLFGEAKQRYQRRLLALQAASPMRLPQRTPAGASAPAPGDRGSTIVATGAPPFVTCIMPTRDRRGFVGRAVAQFLAQDYPHRELIVVDDGADPIGDLLPDDPRVRRIAPGRRLTIGAKRNLACEAARGDLIAHWDDDDWMAAWRLRYQVDALATSGADACGLARLYFYDPAARRAWEYVYPAGARGWVAGGTLCYRTALWRAHRFPDINEGEDTRFVWGLGGARLLALDDARFYVATIHASNTSRKRTGEPRYRPCAADLVERIMRADAPLVCCIMPTRDRRPFVTLAIDGFLQQDHPHRELVIVDDGLDAVDDLVPPDPRIRYVRTARAPIGAKRNIAVREASGAFVAHWDDDDWYAPGRLTAQMRPLLAGEADIVGLSMRHVLALPALEFWRCEPELHARLHHRDLCCGTIVYPRAVWERHGPYPALNVGEDVRLIQRAGAGGARVRRLDTEELFVCVRHGRNTWRIAQDWTSGRRGWTKIERPSFFTSSTFDRYVAAAARLAARPERSAVA